MNKLGILEGLLFVVGDEGIDIDTIKEILDITESEARELLLKLKDSYESSDRGLKVSFLGNTFKLTTKEEHSEYYEKLFKNPKNNILSNAAIEVLAIIAYNEPITRIEIDEIRGVASSSIIRKLLARGLIKEAGKSKLPGRPNLYKTTPEFLDAFGLSSINDLPEIEVDKKDEEDETELFTSIYKEDQNE